MRANYDVSKIQVYRLQDLVAREVSEAYTQLQSARDRVACMAEDEMLKAKSSANDNFKGLGEVKRIGGQIASLVIRPLETIAAEQAFTSGILRLLRCGWRFQPDPVSALPRSGKPRASTTDAGSILERCQGSHQSGSTTRSSASEIGWDLASGALIPGQSLRRGNQCSQGNLPRLTFTYAYPRKPRCSAMMSD